MKVREIVNLRTGPILLQNLRSLGNVNWQLAKRCWKNCSIIFMIFVNILPISIKIKTFYYT